MQQNMLLLQSVNACCRLPFLRHTPLKELYRLAKYLNEVKYTQGDIILHQVCVSHACGVNSHNSALTAGGPTLCSSLCHSRPAS